MDETTLTRTLRDLAGNPALHTAPAADARARARRLQRQHRLSAAAAVVVVAAGAFGVRDLAGGSSTGPAAGASHMLTIQQVKYEKGCVAEPMVAGELKSYDGVNCYLLEPTALTVHPKAAQALYDSSQGYLVQVSLDDADRIAFGALTNKVVSLPTPGNQLAIVLDGVVLSAPTVQQAIEGGVFQITGGETPFTKADADTLAAGLTD